MARVYHADARRAVDRAAAVRRLRPGPRSGDDVRPDDGDARGGARRAVPHRLLRHRRSTTTPPTSRARARRSRRTPARRRLPSTTCPGALADVAEVVARDPRRPCPAPRSPGAARRCRSRAALEAVGFDRDVGPFPRTPLADGSRGDDRALPAALARATGWSRPPRRQAAEALRRSLPRMPARQREQREELRRQEAAASQSTASNEPVASRTAPRRTVTVAPIV